MSRRYRMSASKRTPVPDPRHIVSRRSCFMAFSPQSTLAWETHTLCLALVFLP
jgi:hypothetical protein